MISWLQINLQKHFRVVFIILLVVLVVAFVFTIGNQGPMSGRDEKTADLYFFDTPLNTEAARTQFQQDAQLSVSLNRNSRASQTLPFERATVLHIANEHSIPQPTTEQLRAFIETLPAFQNASGEFDPQAYNMIVDSLSFGAFSQNDLRRVLVDDYRINKVYSVLRGAGFVDETEILDSLAQRLASWSILFAEYDLSSYTPEVEITEDMLRKHYEDFSFTYQTPERRVVDYIEVDANDYVEEIKPTEDELINYYEANIERYQPTAPEGEESPATITFEQARLAVRSDLRLEQAREIASEKAHDLVVEIVDKELSRDSASLEDAISSLGAEVKTASSFAANETPIGTTWGRDVVGEAFSLTESRFYSEPIQHGNKTLVLFYNQVIPPVVPSFENLRDRVALDVRAELYREARANYATELKGKLEEASESEDSFGTAAEEAGMTVGSYYDFTLSEPAEGLDRRALSAMLNLEPGDVSDFVRLDGENKGAFIYVVSKDVPEVSKDDPQYTEVEQSLKNLYGQFSANQYIQDLMLAEQLRAGLVQATN
ncbi:peptidyl-prolyl cis-trans isomerase [Pelagicoccus albus]|uniref:Peptidyl-prolyl cis-trans isomerase n=1 Tax=Pelagicoccus albus TaxID=415222 RepID=A0A7X1B9M4_9BACT|nr:peptidyl-prolyl cis-trans isomerase [Pelagicoccus albus]MBC2608219.1 peptidyl-prolyl cis-trans isomerase [Pelagicoccus albus]